MATKAFDLHDARRVLQGVSLHSIKKALELLRVIKDVIAEQRISHSSPLNSILLTDLFYKSYSSADLESSLRVLECLYRNFFDNRANLASLKSKGVLDSFKGYTLPRVKAGTLVFENDFPVDLYTKCLEGINKYRINKIKIQETHNLIFDNKGIYLKGDDKNRYSPIKKRKRVIEIITLESNKGFATSSDIRLKLDDDFASNKEYPLKDAVIDINQLIKDRLKLDDDFILDDENGFSINRDKFSVNGKKYSG